MPSVDPSPEQRTFRLLLAYDGTAYGGWQRQNDVPTIQGVLEAAVAKIVGHKVHVQGSGRTDAGVHALGQVASFRAKTLLTPAILCRALNAELPHDLAVLEVTEAVADFHPTRDARRKHYRYLIHDGPVRDVFRRQFCWEYRYGRLDAEAMQRAAAALCGTHDFSSFQTSGAPRRSSVRTVFRLDIQRGRAGECHLLSVDVEANGFLYNMVRAIVGTLVEVGRGRRGEDWPGEVLRAADRRSAGPNAPARGLFLVEVGYDV